MVEDEELSGGDFVRTTKQLIDLLRQLSLLAPVPATRDAAREAAAQLFRGVVAASTAARDRRGGRGGRRRRPARGLTGVGREGRSRAVTRSAP